MATPRRLARHVAAGLLALVLGASAAAAGSLVGKWKLVEQRYGAGQANLVADEPQPVRVEFFRDGAAVRGRLRAGERDFPWPQLIDDPRRTIHVEEQRLAPAEDRIVVRYRVDPAPGDDLVLQVVEDYGLEQDGRALVGTVEVRFVRGGEDRGSYLLHRRFERQP